MLCLVNGIWRSRSPTLGCCGNAILENTDSPQQVGLETPVVISVNEMNYGLRENLKQIRSTDVSLSGFGLE